MQDSTLATRAQDQIASVIGKAQGLAVSAVSQVSETIGTILPELPRTPLSERLPDPAEVVTTTFGFAEQLLEMQKAYALELLEAVTPVTGKIVPPANRKPARRSTKAKA